MERLIYIMVLCFFVSSVLITQSSAAIGAACGANSVTCDGANEVCESNVCVCETGFINNAGTCEAFDCSSGGCKNGGTCGASQAKTCTCVTGWKGDDCGRATLGVDCSGGAAATACTDVNSEVCGTGDKCSCKPGFEDDSGTCKDIDECASNPCKNGGTCANGANAYTCTCAAGWTGTTCETGTLNADCSGDETFCSESDTNSECDADTKKCVCKSGFIDGGAGACSKAADNSAGRIVMAALTVILTVITTTNLF